MDNSHSIDMSERMQNSTISFKYTIDYPKIELNPFDTKRFSIMYNETDAQGITIGSSLRRPSMADKHTVQQMFDRKLELKALSRESRDLISLILRCFSAQNYFINSKIINAVEDHAL